MARRPVSIAKWIAIVEKIEPLVWADGELEEYERYRQASRAFNIEAVRNQMGNPGDVKLSLQVFSSRGFRACKVRSYSPGRSERSERRPGSIAKISPVLKGRFRQAHSERSLQDRSRLLMLSQASARFARSDLG